MSGALAGLAQYADSDSDSDSSSASKKASKVPGVRSGVPHQDIDPEASRPVRPKRKLPSLDVDLVEDATASDQASDGKATKKVARGDWLCYCFVEVMVDTLLHNCIKESHAYLQEQLGPDHALLDLRDGRDVSHSHDKVSRGSTPDTSSQPSEHLHISLIRPFTVRSYERDDYVKVATAEVERLTSSVSSFPFSFSRIAYLANDDASRHFMVLEVGSGREKLHQLSSSLGTELRRAFRAKAYYDEARYHASTACVMASSSRPSVETLGPRFSAIVDEVEAKWGLQLRKCPAVWARRIGVQVADRVTYVDI